MNIHLIAAARPNFMKIAPLYHALKKEEWANPHIVHTGQHYDFNMSDSFFTDLRLPAPHFHLGAGTGTHAEQTGNVMIAYEKVLYEQKPDLVIVVGDVNSTLACTLAAVKVQYNGRSETPSCSCDRPVVAHLEAGLRSFDRTMPEEINRIATDALADLLWTPSADGDENLIREGIDQKKIIRVGNIMIDSLEMMRSAIDNQNAYKDYGLEKGNYGVVTFHRPANVDNPFALKQLCSSMRNISRQLPLIFPIHPRTRKKLQDNDLMGILQDSDAITLCEPLSYVRFMSLVFNCRMAVTDSGGIQEETTYLGIPCLTIRPNTERPVTITIGTNMLCALNDIESIVATVLAKAANRHRIPELWDGKTADRIVAYLKETFLATSSMAVQRENYVN